MTCTTIPTPPTPLRERMIEDMKLHRLCRTTQRNYLRDVSRFAIWLGRPPDTAIDEDLRRYQIEQTEMGFGAPAMNTAVSALRFFYIRTLDRPDLTRKLHRVKHPRGLPTVLSRDEMGRMLNATTSIKHQYRPMVVSREEYSGACFVPQTSPAVSYFHSSPEVIRLVVMLYVR